MEVIYIGRSFGMLATSQYLLVAPGPYVSNCEVSALPSSFQAGESFRLSIQVADSRHEPWKGPVYLRAIVSGNIILGDSVLRIEQSGVVMSSSLAINGTYTADFVLRRSSLSYVDKSGKILISPDLRSSWNQYAMENSHIISSTQAAADFGYS